MPPPTAKHPIRPNLTLAYDPRTSSWRDTANTQYRFVTRLITSMFEPFDAPATAERLAATSTKPEYAGRTAAEILALWNAKARASRSLGDFVHSIAEHWDNPILYRRPDPQPPHTTMDQFLIASAATCTAMTRIAAHYEILARESLVFSPATRTAAIADLILRDRNKGSLVVADLKTSDSISSDSYGRTARPPFPPIPDSKADRYAMQLDIIAHIIHRDGWFNCPTLPAARPFTAIILIRPFDPDPAWLCTDHRPEAVQAALSVNVA